jgi:hypothetical protein
MTLLPYSYFMLKFDSIAGFNLKRPGQIVLTSPRNNSSFTYPRHCRAKTLH